MGNSAFTFHPGPLRGSIGVPGDKSISHRALIAGAASRAPLQIANLNPGRDVLATREALAALGASIADDGDKLVVMGGQLTSPASTLDCMNSGSTARMLLGACAGANLAATFDGDASLRRRPMEPVAAQLRAFGAKIDTAAGSLPMRLFGTPEVETRAFILIAPSAQVKSALIFAGLFAGVAVTIEGDRGSRDHTERLLRYLGAAIEWNQRSVSLAETALRGGAIEIAGDFSAAAFFITAAAITPGSALVVRGAGINPTRTGLIEALHSMGATIEVQNRRTLCGEPVGDIAVSASQLAPAAISADVALRAIDEIPLIALAAAFARGTTTIAGAGDLRNKESDRVAAVARLLHAVGVESQYERGTLRILGGSPALRARAVATLGDHRTAMAAGVLACAVGPLAIESGESLEISFPGFAAALRGLQPA